MATNYRHLPVLLGEANYRHWELAIEALLDEQDVLKYTESDVPAPAVPPTRNNDDVHEQWRKGRATAYGILINSIGPVLPRLEGAGWEPSGRCPFKLMSKIKSLIPKVSGDAVADLTRDLCALDVGDHKGDLFKYLENFHTLRRRIDSLITDRDTLYFYILLNSFRKVPSLEALYDKHSTIDPKEAKLQDLIDDLYRKANAHDSGIVGYSLLSAKKNQYHCNHCGGNTHPSTKCYLAHPNLIPADYRNRQYYVDMAAKHVCTDTCREGNQSVFVRGSSGILGGSAISG